MYANGKRKQMDVSPSVINDRTMLPVRFVAENIPGCSIEWIGETETVVVSKTINGI